MISLTDKAHKQETHSMTTFPITIQSELEWHACWHNVSYTTTYVGMVVRNVPMMHGISLLACLLWAAFCFCTLSASDTVSCLPTRSPRFLFFYQIFLLLSLTLDQCIHSISFSCTMLTNIQLSFPVIWTASWLFSMASSSARENLCTHSHTSIHHSYSSYFTTRVLTGLFHVSVAQFSQQVSVQ